MVEVSSKSYMDSTGAYLYGNLPLLRYQGYLPTPAQGSCSLWWGSNDVIIHYIVSICFWAGLVRCPYNRSQYNRTSDIIQRG